MSSILKLYADDAMILVLDLLIESNTLIENFDAFAFSAGPGSYTGLRIGAASVKGFAFALDKPIIAVSTLKSMLSAVLSQSINNFKKDNLFCPILDSRKGEVYAALYDSNYKEYLSPFSCVVNSFSFLSTSLILISSMGIFAT